MNSVNATTFHDPKEAQSKREAARLQWLQELDEQRKQERLLRKAQRSPNSQHMLGKGPLNAERASPISQTRERGRSVSKTEADNASPARGESYSSSKSLYHSTGNFGRLKSQFKNADNDEILEKKRRDAELWRMELEQQIREKKERDAEQKRKLKEVHQSWGILGTLAGHESPTGITRMPTRRIVQRIDTTALGAPVNEALRESLAEEVPDAQFVSNQLTDIIAAPAAEDPFKTTRPFSAQKSKIPRSKFSKKPSLSTTMSSNPVISDQPNLPNILDWKAELDISDTDISSPIGNHMSLASASRILQPESERSVREIINQRSNVAVAPTANHNSIQTELSNENIREKDIGETSPSKKLSRILNSVKNGSSRAFEIELHQPRAKVSAKKPTERKRSAFGRTIKNPDLGVASNKEKKLSSRADSKQDQKLPKISSRIETDTGHHRSIGGVKVEHFLQTQIQNASNGRNEKQLPKPSEKHKHEQNSIVDSNRDVIPPAGTKTGRSRNDEITPNGGVRPPWGLNASEISDGLEKARKNVIRGPSQRPPWGTDEDVPIRVSGKTNHVVAEQDEDYLKASALKELHRFGDILQKERRQLSLELK